MGEQVGLGVLEIRGPQPVVSVSSLSAHWISGVGGVYVSLVLVLSSLMLQGLCRCDSLGVFLLGFSSSGDTCPEGSVVLCHMFSVKHAPQPVNTAHLSIHSKTGKPRGCSQSLISRRGPSDAGQGLNPGQCPAYQSLTCTVCPSYHGPTYRVSS